MLRPGRGGVSRLVRLGRDELGAARRALRGAGLPSGDIGDDAVAFFRLDDAAGPLGWAALERHGDAALLRSVIILEDRRGRGAGAELVGRLVRLAGDEGVRHLWLLTETAAPFFAGLGFSKAPREEAPAAIRRTSEFRELCPASAECMTMALAR